jgi:hypothetical protein
MNYLLNISHTLYLNQILHFNDKVTSINIYVLMNIITNPSIPILQSFINDQDKLFNHFIILFYFKIQILALKYIFYFS